MKKVIRLVQLSLVFFKVYDVECQTSLAALPGELALVEAKDFNYRGLPTKLPSDYYVTKYEVTQGLWEEVTDFNPSVYKTSGPRFRVENVSWYDCCVFCNQLSERIGLEPCYFTDEAKTIVYGKAANGSYQYLNSGTVYWKRSAKGYRLPMECEWEYAASGGKLSKGKIYAGSNDLNEVAWFEYNNTPSGTKAVGPKLPNELGLYDMSGNVHEWCFDRYNEIHFGDVYDVCNELRTDNVCMYRGGSFGYLLGPCEVKYRLYLGEHTLIKQHTIGFRIFRFK